MNHNQLFAADCSFIQTKKYILHRILPEEKPYYQALAQAETPDFLQNTPLSAPLAWEELLSAEHLTCSILRREPHAFCGFCQLQWVFSPTPELGIDLLPPFQRQGIAMEILPPFLLQAKKLLAVPYFYAKVKKNNLPAQRLAERLGGVCVGTKSLLPANFPAERKPFAEAQFPELFYLEYHIKNTI